MYDGVGGHDGLVGDEECAESVWSGDVGDDVEVWLHYKSVFVEVEEPGAVRETRHGVSHGGHFRPGWRTGSRWIGEVVVGLV